MVQRLLWTLLGFLIHHLETQQAHPTSQDGLGRGMTVGGSGDARAKYKVLPPLVRGQKRWPPSPSPLWGPSLWFPPVSLLPTQQRANTSPHW